MKVTTRRALLARRTPAEWIGRVALALISAAFGYFGVTHSMALAVENADAERAYRLAPHDGRIVASAAAKRFAVTSEPAAQGPIAQLALTALRQDATAVKAVNMLGLQSQLHGDTAKAQRLFNYAERLSRRELQTQLWSIENAVAHNDVPGALRHYDIALRTNKSAPDILFPILAGAISDPVVRTSAVATLAGKPIWAQSFIVFVAGGGEEPRAVADLLLRLHRRGMRVPDEPSTVVINRLIHDGAAEDAWRYYAAIRPGVKRNSARDPGFAAVFDRPTAFDWTPVNENNVSASVQRTPEGGIFAFSVSPGAGGVLLQQTQMLPPGKYRLDGKSSEIELPQRASPYWVLSCRSGAELGRVVVPNSSYNRGTFSGQFIVPSECPVQTLALVARPSEEISGSSGQIEQVRLIPAG